jgi:transcriptional regulator with XRE-family HTH domain
MLTLSTMPEGPSAAVTPQQLGERIRRLRRERRMSQEALATAAGVSISTVKRVEEGSVKRSYQVDRILAALRDEDEGGPRLSVDLAAIALPEAFREFAARLDTMTPAQQRIAVDAFLLGFQSRINSDDETDL